MAWLFPGAGHLYTKRYCNGIIFAICIYGLYLTGMFMGRGRIVYFEWLNPFAHSEQFRGTYFSQLPIGFPNVLALIQATLKYFDKPPLFWGWMAMPSQNSLNGLQDSLGKQLEIATMYTQVAGILNVIAIIDALGGPNRRVVSPPPVKP